MNENQQDELLADLALEFSKKENNCQPSEHS